MKTNKKTGRTMNRNDWHMKPDEFHLTVLGVLQRPDGKYLITRRNLDKEWAAGWWEVPGGGVRAGEDGADAVKREILRKLVSMSPVPRAAMRFPISVSIRKNRTITLWIFTSTCWILPKQM
ncbi:MAG: NUDIX domain-containing protein [Ruminococcus callidus]